jgi:hypothetical protein
MLAYGTDPAAVADSFSAQDPMRSFLSRTLIAVVCATIPGTARAVAQGVTTASLQGTVRTADGFAARDATVTVTHVPMGYTAHATVRAGRFLIHGLEPGGPYNVRIESPGYTPLKREGVVLALGEPLELLFELRPGPLVLEPLHVDAYSTARTHGGTGTMIPDSLLHALPTLNRNLYDFVRLAPQVSTRIGFAPGGMSGGGAGFRYNGYLINGVPQRSIGGQVPPEFAGARSVPFEAVSEYQVLLAPFDVRYGDFAGALVNAVTRSGTNELRGSAFAFGRSDRIARPAPSQAPYDRLHYGFAAGGPLRRDRAHFLVATEMQYFASPAPGPFVGQAADAPDPLRVAPADVVQMQEILRARGLEPGTAGSVSNRNPQATVLVRTDVALPRWHSRVVLWANGSRADNLSFSRAARDTFPLSSYALTQAVTVWNASLHLHSALNRRGAHNALLLTWRGAETRASPGAPQPVVRVALPALNGGTVMVVAGTPPPSQRASAGGWGVNLRDDLTLPLGNSHMGSFGFEIERFQAERVSLPHAAGTWTFAGLDALQQGVPAAYQVGIDLGSAVTTASGWQHAAWAGTRWDVSARLSVTAGMRADAMVMTDSPPFVPEVEAIFGRRTDRTPAPVIHFSPRLGFAWQPAFAGGDRIRGGLGMFTVRPPVAWLHAPLYGYGRGMAVLSCGATPLDLGPPPAFVTGPDAPRTCGNGVGITQPNGEVELVGPRLNMMRTLRGVLAWDRRLPFGFVGTAETLATRMLSDFLFVNLNLEGPQGLDRNGRVLYGNFGPTGVASPRLRSSFSQVVELQNTRKNHAWQISGRLERPFRAGGFLSAHYTHTRVRDVQTPLRIYAGAASNWTSRAVSGRHEDGATSVSLNDVPHRVVVAATARAPWRRWTTAVSLYYVGEAGNPFTYHAWGAQRRGDLNADGSNTNDPIYVPRSALDTAEIRFTMLERRRLLPGGAVGIDTLTAARQAEAFEERIASTRCLAAQRGRILTRNSCREPWAHVTAASVRQSMPVAGRLLEAQLDVHNVLNLLRRGWGQYRVAMPALLEHAGQTTTVTGESLPLFRFDPAEPQWSTLPAESSFQLQLGVRLRF